MKLLKSVLFSIAGVTIKLESDVEILTGDEFEDFQTTSEPDYVATFRKVPKLTRLQDNLIQKLVGVDIYSDGRGSFIRQFREEDKDLLLYAIQLCDWDNKVITIDYLEEGLRNINHTGGAFFHIAWEDIMLREHRLIFHACCVETEFGGILFSGRSGIGKSTQGDLWCRYENAKLINGDRPILYRDKISGKWLAFGSPYAGSSKCHVNASTAVKVIVMLQQAKECFIRKLNPAEAFRKIYAQLTVSTWDSTCVMLACDSAEQLIKEVPVYEMACTPDYDAVDLLKKTLQQEVRL